MAFGDVYGYKTNSRSVAAIAEGDEDTENGVTTVEHLVLVGFANGRRKNVVVAESEAAAEVNQAWRADISDQGGA